VFRENDQHRQWGMFDTFQQLPERVQKRLEDSWAASFYREVFCRIDESPFSILYSDQPSRPNIPINVLVGAEMLKAGNGWSDEDLYDELQFNLQVRYALGLRDINLVPFDLRTLYNFRQRLSRHMQETGENLLEKVFVQVTDEQLDSLKLKTGQQRMDSVLISSNIRQMTRLQLLIEVVQRVWRILTEEDQAGYAAVFDAYRQGTAGQYCYRVKGQDLSGHLAAVGQLMFHLVGELEAQYAGQPVYQMLRRVFAEHFAVEEEGARESGAEQVRVKVGDELSACSLQSPDDWEATFREKRGQGYRGYIANLAETCDPTNPIQLITHIQAGPNLTDDEQMGVRALPDLKARTDLRTLWTDGGYTGPTAEAAFREYQVEHIPTAIRGCHVSPRHLGLSAFAWEFYEAGNPRIVRCPGRQEVVVRAKSNGRRFLASFDEAVCQMCPWTDRCPAQPRKLRPVRVLYATVRQAQVAQLRQRSLQTRRPGCNWRSAVESTIRCLTHPFGGQAGKLPVRGQPRVTQVIFYLALMVNLRRIWHHSHDLAGESSWNLLSLLLSGLKCFRLQFHGQSVRCPTNPCLVPAKT